ncbi:hypothetical protein CMUS01_13980, partial [Colletotrichum musicola]
MYEYGFVSSLSKFLRPSLRPRLIGDVLCVRGVLLDVVLAAAEELSRATSMQDIGIIWKSWKALKAHSEQAIPGSRLGAFADCVTAGNPLAPFAHVHWEHHFADYVQELALKSNETELPDGLASDIGGNADWASFLAGHIIDKRRLVLTDRCYFGLVPGLSRRGDVVAVVGGTLTPLILREGPQGHSRVVGDAYVTSKAAFYSESGTRQYKLLGDIGAEDWLDWGAEEQDIFLGSVRTSKAAREDKVAPQAVALRRPWLGRVCVLDVVPHHKPESAFGDQIQDALFLLPTIFPIAFAARCGKGMKSIALYKSQTGMSLRLLELLSGSSSLFSALERVILLRHFGIVSIITTIMWLLSPLGGQALSPRLLTKERFYANYTQEATSLSSDFLNRFSLDSGSGALTVLPRVATVYLSSLSSSVNVRGSPRDVWGNPKLSVANWDAGEADSDGWKSLAVTNNTDTYTNLLGLPVKAFGDRTTSEFTVPSIDLKVRCSSLELTDTDTFKNNLKEPLVANFTGGGSYPNGTTSIVIPTAHPSFGFTTAFLFFGQTSWSRFVTDRTQPINIFYGVRAPFDPTKRYRPKIAYLVSLATCTMLPRGLEFKVACEGQVCRAVAARKVLADLENTRT